MTTAISLRQRLIRLILIVSGGALLLVVVGMLVFELAFFRPHAISRLEEEASILNLALRAPLEFQDMNSAGEFLHEPRFVKTLELAVVYDDATNYFAGYSSAGAASQPPPTVPSPGIHFVANHVSLWQPIKRGPRVLGWLYLQESIPPIYARSPQDLIMVAVVTLVLIVVSVLLLAGVRLYFLNPLSALVTTTTEVTRRADYRIRATIKNEDELGRLAQAFNQMLETIGRRDAALLEANAQIKNVFDSATGVLIVATDVEGIVQLFNTGAERMLGYAAAEIVGRQTPELWHVEEETGGGPEVGPPTVRRKLKGFAAMVEPARQGLQEPSERIFVRQDGTRLQVQVVITAIRNPEEGIIGFLGVASDITERKRAEMELVELQRQQERILTAVGEGLHGIDREGNIIFENPAAVAMLGWDPKEIIGLPAHRVMHHTRADGAPYPQEECPIHATLRDGQVRRMEGEVFWRKDGSSFPVTYTCTPIRTEFGDIIGTVVAFRDVTHELQLEADLRQAQKMEAIGLLAGGVAHDFNNILSSLLLQAQMIEMIEHLPAEAREGLRQINADTHRAADLTRQLLLFGRRQVMQMRELNLNDLITNLSKMLQRMIREDVQLHLDLAPPPILARADPGMIEQVLMNLAVNARDAMPRGGQLRITTSEITVAAEAAGLEVDERPGRFVCLSVSDTGSGISPEILPRIFEPFFTTKAAGKGTGLGLATVFGIVKQHQGWIKVDNRPGQGVTFQVFLPASAATALAATAPEARPKPHGGTETIFLVEDELVVRQQMRGFLERFGYQVLVAADGVQALKLWQEQRGTIPLLLTDLVMPGGLNGLELARQLKAKQPGLKVIYTSGYSADFAGREFQLGAQEAFIQKPFATDDLLVTIRRLLDAGNG